MLISLLIIWYIAIVNNLTIPPLLEIVMSIIITWKLFNIVMVISEVNKEVMSQATSNSSNGGVGFVDLLTIVFITLKLTHVIDWSWWWVLSPIWISTGIVVGALLIGLGIYLIYKAFTRKRG